MITMDFDKPYCVYFHWLDDAIIYVGSGTLSRAFSTTRNSLWEEKTRYRKVQVEIVSLHEDRDLAFGAERRYIELFQPECNIMLRPRVRKNGMVRCNETGEVYSSATHAAHCVGVTRGAMANVLNGRYASVKGLTFSRIP